MTLSIHCIERLNEIEYQRAVELSHALRFGSIVFFAPWACSLKLFP